MLWQKQEKKKKTTHTRYVHYDADERGAKYTKKKKWVKKKKNKKSQLKLTNTYVHE